MSQRPVPAQDADRSGASPAPLTPARQAVLDILSRERRAVGAYELIDRLQSDKGRRPAPAQVYRALDYLVARGFAHRLASRNAFLACDHTHEARQPVAFLICEGCGRVEEASCVQLIAQLTALSEKMHFAARAQTIEVTGLCAACAP